MSLPGFVPGLPGVRTAKIATHRIVFKQGWFDYLALGKIISGANSRDPGNTGDLNVLRPGVLMGKRSADSKYAPSIIGVTQGALATNGTSITLAAAEAAELVRRNGASGTFTLTGPPAAAGTVATSTVTYSAVNTSTGVVTISTTGVAFIAGSFVGAGDGSQVPNTLIPDGYGIIVTDIDNTTNIDVPFAQLPIAGVIISSQVLCGAGGYPTDTSLQAWIKTNLSTTSGGKMIFDDQY